MWCLCFHFSSIYLLCICLRLISFAFSACGRDCNIHGLRSVYPHGTCTNYEYNQGGICSGHGTCSDGAAGTGLCTCAAGYISSDCSEVAPCSSNHAKLASHGGLCTMCPGGQQNPNGQVKWLLLVSLTLICLAGSDLCRMCCWTAQ